MAISALTRGAAGIVKVLPYADVYLIGGPSGAGKTAFAKVFSNLRPVVVLQLDDYFLDEKVVRVSLSSRYGRARQWDHPASVDLSLALRNTIELLDHDSTQVPSFSFAQNRRVGYRSCSRSSKESILVEGLHALELQSHVGVFSTSVYSIFINAEVSIRRKRISVRDARNRSRPLHEFDRRFHFMRIAETRWILPQRRKADLIIDTSDGGFRIVEHDCKPGVLKKRRGEKKN